MKYELTIFDNIEMKEIKKITIDGVSTLSSACKIAELHQEEVSFNFPDTTIQLERLDND